MGVFLALARRELGMAFKSPVGWIVVAVVMGLTGISLADLLAKLGNEAVDAPFPQVFFARALYFWVVLLMAAPAITMRSFAGEKASGTYETLMTAPVGDWQVVLAKYAGAMGFFLAVWAPIFGVFAALRKITGEPSFFEPASALGGFIGVVAVGSLYMSMGCLASSLTRSQMAAAMLSFLMGGALWVSGLRWVSENAADHGWRAAADYCSVIRHMNDFSAGVVDSRALVFYPTATAFFLFLTVRVVEGRRWK